MGRCDHQRDTVLLLSIERGMEEIALYPSHTAPKFVSADSLKHEARVVVTTGAMELRQHYGLGARRVPPPPPPSLSLTSFLPPLARPDQPTHSLAQSLCSALPFCRCPFRALSMAAAAAAAVVAAPAATASPPPVSPLPLYPSGWFWLLFPPPFLSPRSLSSPLSLHSCSLPN